MSFERDKGAMRGAVWSENLVRGARCHYCFVELEKGHEAWSGGRMDCGQGAYCVYGVCY